MPFITVRRDGNLIREFNGLYSFISRSLLCRGGTPSATLHHLPEANEPVCDQHAAGDDDDLDERHRGDGRIDLPFKVLKDRDWQRRLTGRHEEKRDLEIAEGDDETEERPRHHAPPDPPHGNHHEPAP